MEINDVGIISEGDDDLRYRRTNIADHDSAYDQHTHAMDLL